MKVSIVHIMILKEIPSKQISTNDAAVIHALKYTVQAKHTNVSKDFVKGILDLLFYKLLYHIPGNLITRR